MSSAGEALQAGGEWYKGPRQEVPGGLVKGHSTEETAMVRGEVRGQGGKGSAWPPTMETTLSFGSE